MMYILYGGRFTRAIRVEMVMAEGDIEYELRDENIPGTKQQTVQSALKNISVLNQHLTDHGPYYLGDRFSLVDLNMAYWSTFINEVEHTLEPVLAVLECVSPYGIVPNYSNTSMILNR